MRFFDTVRFRMFSKKIPLCIEVLLFFLSPKRGADSRRSRLICLTLSFQEGNLV